MNSIPPYSSNPFDTPIHREGEFSPVSDHSDYIGMYLGTDTEGDDVYLSYDDFWYDEEERHELF